MVTFLARPNHALQGALLDKAAHRLCSRNALMIVRDVTILFEKLKNTMKKILSLFHLLLVVFAIGGCAVTNETSLVVGKTRTPTTADQVKLYTKPPAKYEQIAIVSADAAHAFMSKQDLMNISIANLKQEAAKFGANGILLDSAGDFYAGSSGVIVIPSAKGGAPVIATGAMNAQTGQKASGMAIFVIEEK